MVPILILLFAFAGSSAFYADSNVVEELNNKTFDSIVRNSGDVWFIHFYSPKNPDCQEFSDQFNRAGKALSGFVRFGAVNVDEQHLLAYQYGIKKIPTTVCIRKTKKSFHYGGINNGTGLVAAAIEMIAEYADDKLKNKFVDNEAVRELSRTELDTLVKASNKRWMVAFYSSKEEDTNNFSTLWQELAKKFNETIRFGAYDYSSEDKNDFGSSIIFYHRGDATGIPYEGSHDFEEVTDWVMDKIKKPKIHEITDDKYLMKTCVKSKYCVVTILPILVLCDKDCQKNTNRMVQKVSEKYKEYSWTWVVVKEGKIPVLERIVGALNINRPFITMVHVKTLKHQMLKKPFSEVALVEMLEDVVHGRGFDGKDLPVFENVPEKYYKPWIHDEL